MSIRVQTPAGIAEFPDGTDPQAIEAALQERFPMDPMASHGEPSAEPPAKAGPITGRGTQLDVRKSDAWAKNNAPTIGAALATAATGGAALPLSVLAAGAGGAAGSALRGDDLGTIAKQGAIQGGLELGGGLALKAGRGIAHGLMRGTVPKNIAKNFSDVDIAGTMLDRGVVPGSASSADRVSGLSAAANAERDAAAAAVPTMPRSKIIEGLRPIYAKGVSGKVPSMSEAALDQMRQSAREIGPAGLSGEQALARKDIKQAMGNAALNAADQRTAAFGSQLANAERGSIVSHLRETPRMEKALDESQALMAVDQVMQDAAHSNPVTRMRIGGIPAASLSPKGMATTAHVVNQGRKVLSPEALRAIALMNLLQGDQ